ncbi:MAG TPA: glycosyltransferase family 2 protein [Patescibacteria group bacterium]|nr:glycosyltransferase family 2 protein [Patescibacteria group bacterium]
MGRKKLISIGIPCYNEELNVIPAYEALSSVVKDIPGYVFEFIYVDNGSEDNTREMIRSVVKKDKRVRGIFLSRNFGPESSGEATMDFARGDAFIYYESDMQDPVDIIPKFIKKWEEGYDVVVGIRTKIEDNIVMTMFRKSFYRVFKAISNIDVPVNAGSFSLVGKRPLDAMRALPERYRFYRGLRAWVGFKRAYITYARKRRARGKSSYNLLEYFHHAERSFFGFSYMPLDFIVYLGILLVFLAVIIFSLYLIYYFFYDHTHNASIPIIIVGITLFFGGVQLLALSFVGKYVQVIVEETKGRPSYIVEEKI